MSRIAQRVPELNESPDKLVVRLGSKSSAIRYLHARGWNRSQIAEFLDLRYQHVRTVLITPLTSDKIAC